MDFNRLCRGCFREKPTAGISCPFCGFGIFAAYVYDGAVIGSGGYVSKRMICVRPVLWINLGSE